MTNQQFMLSLVFMTVAMFVYNLYRTNARILCRYSGRDKRVRKKWAKSKNGERIEFDNGWYYIITKCIKLDATFFNLLPVRVLEFSYLSKYPNNPDTGEPLAETPEMRKNLNKREDVEALEFGSQRALGKGKVGVMGGGLLPIILVVAVVASLYLNWQSSAKIDMLGQAINVLQEMQMKK